MSPTEVAGAVTDLLKAAGMPLDLERRQLLQQSLVLQRQAKEAQEELAKQARVSFADLHRGQLYLFMRYRNPSGGARVLLAAAPRCSNAAMQTSGWSHTSFADIMTTSKQSTGMFAGGRSV